MGKASRKKKERRQWIDEPVLQYGNIATSYRHSKAFERDMVAMTVAMMSEIDKGLCHEESNMERSA